MCRPHGDGEGLTINHIIDAQLPALPVAVPVGPVHPRHEQHGQEVAVRVDDHDAALLLVAALARPQAALLDVARHGLRQDGLQPALLVLGHDEAVAEEEGAGAHVLGVLEHDLGVDEEEAVGVDEDDLAEARQQDGEGLGGPAADVPADGVHHGRDVARDDAVEVLEVLPRVAVQVAVADVHDLDGQVAAQPPQDGDLREKVRDLVVARRQRDAAPALLEVRPQRHVVGEVGRREGEEQLVEVAQQPPEVLVRVDPPDQVVVVLAAAAAHVAGGVCRAACGVVVAEVLDHVVAHVRAALGVRHDVQVLPRLEVLLVLAREHAELAEARLARQLDGPQQPAHLELAGEEVDDVEQRLLEAGPREELGGLVALDRLAQQPLVCAQRHLSGVARVLQRRGEGVCCCV